MNDQKKGTFTVIVATIVTSLMILVTDNSIAKSPDVNKTDKEQQGLSVENDMPAVMAKESVDVTEIGSQVTSKQGTSNLLPPPGPFMQEASDL